MRVGVVFEGRTDYMLLRQVVLAALGPCEIRPLQPRRDSVDETRWSDGGWPRVKEWCEERGLGGIADEMAIGGYDVIVVQVDGDLCGREGLPPTRTALCDHIKVKWMGTATPPPGTVICIPAPATDIWLVAALDPTIATPALESDPGPLGHLVRLGVLLPSPAGEKAPRKNQHAYKDHADKLGARALTLRTKLPELNRFMSKLEALAS